MNVKQEWINAEHWKQINEEKIMTTNGEEIINYLYVFNVRFNFDRLIRIEESSIPKNHQERLLAEGYEYTDKDNIGVLLKFKTTRGDVYYQGASYEYA